MTDTTARAATAGPFSRFELIIAGRYLRARRKETFISVISWLTLIGVALGVATLIVVMSVMSGFRDELLTKILGLNGHFTAYPIDATFSDYDDTAMKLEKVNGVLFAIPYVEGQALATGQQQSTGVSVRGISAASIDKLKLLKNGAVLGGWDQWDQGQGIAIGQRLAEKLGVTIGDPVTIVNPNGANTPFGKTPQIRSFPVNVIFDLGMVEFDSFYIYMPMQPAQTYFKLFEDVLRPGAAPPGPTATDEEIDAAYERQYQATAVEVFIDDPDNVEAVRKNIQDQVDRPLILYDWQQRNETFFSALQVERVVMFVILSAIILVAAFNIVSSLVMLVKDKSSDIAILRTMGATRGAIMRIFSMTGFVIGFAGTVLGLVLGLLVASNAEPLRAFFSNLSGVAIFPPEVFFLSSLPSRVNPVEVTAVVCLSLGLTFLATLYPAWRAAQYDPSRPSDMSEPHLRLTNVHRHFGKDETFVRVLEAASLEVQSGELVAIVAPSGAGKSTLLHLSGLLEKPQAGEIEITGTRTSSLNDRGRTLLRRTTIGYVYQFHHLLPEFSALENVSIPQLIAGKGQAEADKRSRVLLDLLGVGPRAAHRPAELSGGEQQRVAIARAAANHPRVILADEPTGNLDPATSELVFAALQELIRNEGAAGLIATHNHDLARRADRIVTLRDGLVEPLTL